MIVDYDQSPARLWSADLHEDRQARKETSLLALLHDAPVLSCVHHQQLAIFARLDQQRAETNPLAQPRCWGLIQCHLMGWGPTKQAVRHWVVQLYAKQCLAMKHNQACTRLRQQCRRHCPINVCVCHTCMTYGFRYGLRKLLQIPGEEVDPLLVQPQSSDFEMAGLERPDAF